MESERARERERERESERARARARAREREPARDGAQDRQQDAFQEKHIERMGSERENWARQKQGKGEERGSKHIAEYSRGYSGHIMVRRLCGWCSCVKSSRTLTLAPAHARERWMNVFTIFHGFDRYTEICQGTPTSVFARIDDGDSLQPIAVACRSVKVSAHRVD
eukprot:5069873-Pleurochrysis_carterae.AAC.1